MPASLERSAKAVHPEGCGLILISSLLPEMQDRKNFNGAKSLITYRGLFCQAISYTSQDESG
jgi:hypothetical protein